MDRLAPLDARLLDEFQRDLPLVSRPFAAMAALVGASEAEVIRRLGQLTAEGKVARVGATVHPNTVGASTLAALAVPEDRLEELAELVGREPGVNHSYQREHDWNLWFVATAPDATGLAALLDRIRAAAGLPVLDLPLLRAFNIDLGFPLAGPRPMAGGRTPDVSLLTPEDRPLLHALSTGLPLVPEPFAALARQLDRSETEVLARIRTHLRSGVIARLGVIVRHRPLGWTSNAMVAWQVADDRVDAAGLALAGLAGVTLCYRRRTVPGVWTWGLFSMIHGRSRAEALSVLDEAARLPQLRGADRQLLFSTRCFKQTGARISEAA